MPQRHHHAKMYEKISNTSERCETVNRNTETDGT